MVHTVTLISFNPCSNPVRKLLQIGKLGDKREGDLVRYGWVLYILRVPQRAVQTHTR